MEDGNSAAELIHNRGRDDGWRFDEASQMAGERANDIIRDADQLRELDAYCEATTYIYAHIARVMANLDKACKGDQVSIDAVLSACSNMQRELRNRAYEMVEDECEREVFNTDYAEEL